MGNLGCQNGRPWAHQLTRQTNSAQLVCSNICQNTKLVTTVLSANRVPAEIPPRYIVITPSRRANRSYYADPACQLMGSVIRPSGPANCNSNAEPACQPNGGAETAKSYSAITPTGRASCSCYAHRACQLNPPSQDQPVITPSGRANCSRYAHRACQLDGRLNWNMPVAAVTPMGVPADPQPPKTTQVLRPTRVPTAAVAPSGRASFGGGQNIIGASVIEAQRSLHISKLLRFPPSLSAAWRC